MNPLSLPRVGCTVITRTFHTQHKTQQATLEELVELVKKLTLEVESIKKATVGAQAERIISVDRASSSYSVTVKYTISKVDYLLGRFPMYHHNDTMRHTFDCTSEEAAIELEKQLLSYCPHLAQTKQ